MLEVKLTIRCNSCESEAEVIFKNENGKINYLTDGIESKTAFYCLVNYPNGFDLECSCGESTMILI